MVQYDQPCPCGNTVPFPDHCGRVHRDGAGLGVTAESLMRARYSAYVMHNRTFLMDSWHYDSRPGELNFDPELAWLGLEIVATEAGTALHTEGIVEFRARFSRGGEFLELHERSSFVRVDGHWKYLSALE